MQNKLLDQQNQSLNQIEMGEQKLGKNKGKKDEPTPYLVMSDEKQSKKQKKKFLSGSEDEEDKIDVLQRTSSQSGEETSQPTDQSIVIQVELPVLTNAKKSTNKKPKSSSLQKKSKIKIKKKKKLENIPFKWNTYRFLLSYPLLHWKWTLFVHILILATSILGVYFPLIIGQLLDATTKNNDEESHSKLSSEFLKILLVLSVLQFFRAFANQVWQEKIYINLRHDVLAQFLKFDLNFFNKYRNGEIISRMTSDLYAAKSAVSGNIINFFRNIIVCLSNIIVLLMLSWKLTFFVLATIPPFLLITAIYSRLLKLHEKYLTQYQADLTAVADEIVSGMLTIKSFCGEERELKKFDLQLQNFLKLSYRRGLNYGVYEFSSVLFIQLGTLIVLWYGGKLVLENGQLSPGELASFIFYSIQLSNSSSDISEAYSKIIMATGSFEGVLNMLQYQSLVTEQLHAVEPQNLQGEIEFKSVYFSYPNTNVVVLKNFSLKIGKGEYVAFVGMSGSGKSTTVQLIERFYDPQQGCILLDGMDIKQLKLKSLRSCIGLVSQEPILFEGTVENNITYGVEHYSQDDLEWAAKASGAWSFIMESNQFPKKFKSYISQGGGNLSGGQKQRIAIARALIKRPKILIFDEATSALDSQSEYLVQSSIDQLVQNEKSITIIVIAHRLSTIVNSNRIIVFNQGEVVEQGKHQELMEKNGIYKRLVERQIQGIITDEDLQ